MLSQIISGLIPGINSFAQGELHDQAFFNKVVQKLTVTNPARASENLHRLAHAVRWSSKSSGQEIELDAMVEQALKEISPYLKGRDGVDAGRTLQELEEVLKNPDYFDIADRSMSYSDFADDFSLAFTYDDEQARRPLAVEISFADDDKETIQIKFDEASGTALEQYMRFIDERIEDL